MTSLNYRLRAVFFALFLTLCSSWARAGVGDTTIVRGFANLLHQNCNTGRGTFAFPRDSISYYKIMLKYQLSCPSFGCDIYDRIATLKVLKPTGRFDSILAVAPSFRINNQRVDSFAYMTDTSYSYSWDSLAGSVDSVPLNPVTVVFYNDSLQPFQPTDTLVVWPAYYNQYTFSGGVATDSVLVSPDGVLLVQLDSIYTPFELKEPFEIARAITPYGMAVTLWFDVTDYQSLLRDSVTFESRVCGYSNGWLVTNDFYFIEGQPPMHAYKVANLWNGTWQYGNASNPIDNHLQPITLHRDSQSVAEKVRLITTGHGFGGYPDQNVAEFSEYTHTLRINSTDLPQHLWRDDCGSNPLYAQGAPGYTSTWFYKRANWCPGSYVTPHDFDATPFAAPGDSFTVDYNLVPYTCTGGPSGFYFPEYYIQSQVISYDSIAFTNNVAVLAIKKPTSAFEYNRINPVCPEIAPEVLIKNYGTAPITSLNFNYMIDATPMMFMWTGNLQPMDTVTVSLQPLPWVGSGTHTLFVEAVSPNASTDEFPYDNALSTTFGTGTSYNTNYVRILMKTDNSPEEVSWKVRDGNGNVVASRSVFAAPLTTYIDTVYLSNGCYTATAYDSFGDGVCCYNGSGFFRVLKGQTAVIVGTKGDYGDFYSVNFNIDFQSSIGDEPLNDERIFIYPNPSDGNCTINTSVEAATMQAQLFDLIGNKTGEEFKVEIAGYHGEVHLPALANGIYLLRLYDEKRSLFTRIHILR